MSADSVTIPGIPKETVRAASAVFGRGNFYIQLGEQLEAILDDIHWKLSWMRNGRSESDDPILALISLFQFVEGLTDVQAIDAVRSRVDWKFALHLSLLPRTLHEAELCGFRQVILGDVNSQEEFQKLIDRIAIFIPSRSQSFQHLRSVEAVSFVCLVNCLNRAQQAMNEALSVLASQFPDWLRRITLPHWYGRYSQATPRLEVALLLGQQRFLVEELRADIHHLLEEIQSSGLQAMRELREVKALDSVWSQQLLNYCHFEETGNDFRLRVVKCPARMSESHLSTCCRNS